LVLAWFFIDRWIESGLEAAGEALIGSRVEIDGLDLKLFPLAVRFNRLQVASTEDSLANFFETGPVRYRMDFGQLLRGKTVIDSMEVIDLILGTRRTSSGFLPGQRKGYVPSSMVKDNLKALMDELLQRVKASTPLFDPALWRGKINVDSLIKAQNFQTLVLVDSLKRLTATSVTEWENTVRDFNEAKVRLEALKVRLLEIRPAELKTVDEISKAIATVDATRKTVNELTTTYQDRYATVSTNVKELSASVKSIDDAVAGDIKHVLALARLPDINTMGLAELLVGEKILSDAKQIAGYVDKARSLAAQYTPKPLYEFPERFKGQDIHFPVTRGYPELWIKHLKISGGTDSEQQRNFIHLSGVMNNISSDQRIAGAPLSLTLDGVRGKTLSFGLTGQIDRRQQTPMDQYRARIRGIEIGAFKLGKADFLPAVISRPTLSADITVNIPGSSFTTSGELKLSSISLAFQSEPRHVGERLAREVLTGVNKLDVGFKVWRGNEGMNAAFSTDLDNQFADGVKRVVGAELTKLQNQLAERVQREIAAKRSEFENYFNAKRDEVQKQLDAYQALVDENKRMIEERKKELEQRLEQVKKGALDKVKDRILRIR